MRGTHIARSIGLLTLALIAGGTYVAASPGHLAALVVGWSDEFHRLNWQPLPAPNAPAVSLLRHGGLHLSLDTGATDVSQSTPFYWASVSRFVTVDTDKYPILAVRASHLTEASWWDVDIQGDPAAVNNPHGLFGAEVKTPSLDHDGVVLFDLQAQEKNGLRLAGHRMRLRLNIAGTAPGGSVDYDWIRFIRRQDEARVAANPRIRDIVTEP